MLCTARRRSWRLLRRACGPRTLMMVRSVVDGWWWYVAPRSWLGVWRYRSGFGLAEGEAGFGAWLIFGVD